MIRLIVFCFAVLTLISGVLCEIIPREDCDKNKHEVKNCVINQASLSPCKEALKTPPAACKLKKNKIGVLEVDFTPSFVSNNLTARLYWSNGIFDVPLPNMDTDACKTTKCPTEKDQQQKYTYNLLIDPMFPQATYNVKYLLQGDDESNESCCFIFKIKISK